ncbi:hypothetical protein L6R44_08995 [Enterobacter cloacae complex sp. ECC445]|uniref:hypothetical protein n=1 Tax=Enterobacter cloacae complex sp. ECC445 TaxID=2913213 RepID=UPI001F1C87E8|nr:hypothetical protein [Enterobacter cloacae complex sp. ECC445]MCG0456237.1 hypothetical protein [Enterobacter cloacae complex sp. ECC445]
MLMTKAAYARDRGVSRQTVYDRTARGGLVLVGGTIDARASEQKRWILSPSLHGVATTSG